MPKSYNYKLKAIGLHNIYNGTASIIAGHLVGVKNSFIKNALKNYIGVKRRFTHLGKVNLADIYDDYAHHPTEIAATLLGAKQINKNIIVVFQPHRYSRTKVLFNDFIKTLSKINKLYLLDTYSAGEKVLKNYEKTDLIKDLKKGKKNNPWKGYPYNSGEIPFDAKPDEKILKHYLKKYISYSKLENRPGFKLKKSKNFKKFKDECNKTGTTEEALANAEKVGFNTYMQLEYIVFPVLGIYNFVTAMKLRYHVVSTIKVIVEFTENMSLTQRQDIFTRILSELKLNEGNRVQSVKLH